MFGGIGAVEKNILVYLALANQATVADIASAFPKMHADRQSNEHRYSIAQVMEGLGECAFLLDIRACDHRRVFNAPMCCRRLSRPCAIACRVAYPN
jgi:hypothetical protein